MTTPRISVHQSGTWKQVFEHPAYEWACEEPDCGWLGVGCTSEAAALREAARHCDREHGEPQP